jgi:hypothetical protein
MGSRPLQYSEGYHAPIGRSVTDFTMARWRKGGCFCCGCVRQELADTVEKGKNEPIEIFAFALVEIDLP